MMLRVLLRLGFLIPLCSSGSLLKGQDLLQDTVLLEPVIIMEVQEEEYANASLTTELPFIDHRTSSLNNSLQTITPVHVNEYGAKGQLASINLRGVGASRTALVWNGIPINSLTNGQVDLNLINLRDTQIRLSRGGGASTIYGNGAIGGVISLRSTPNFNEAPNINFGQAIGSFGFRQSDVGLSFGNEKFAYKLAGSVLSVENDFEYDLRGEDIIQSNASYSGVNVQQDFSWLLSRKSSIQFNIWFSENDRQIQPSKGNFSSDDTLFDRNFRGVLRYSHQLRSWSTETTLGYIQDYQVYNDQSPLIVDHFFNQLQGETSLSTDLKWLVGINNSWIAVKGASFEERPDEIRNDFYSLLTWSPDNNFSAILNLRQPTVDGDLKPFTPSLLTRWQFLKTEKLSSGIHGQVSRSYRLATLNDRFWSPGGNPDLDSETSLNIDLGLETGLDLGEFDVSLSGNVYRSDVDNWILWRPGGREVDEDGRITSFWFPQNLESVLSEGIEYSLKLDYDISENLNIQIGNNSNHSRAINKISVGDADRSFGKQLAFTPTETHLSFINLQVFGWGLGVNSAFTGKRFTEANNELDPLPSYRLYNFHLSKEWQLNKWRIGLFTQVKNFTNQDYESYENRAMPGINYDLTININYSIL